MNPRYSFIIPAYNEESLIGRTLDALRESAAQLQGGFEIIVANDDSTDRTPEIAREKGARIIESALAPPDALVHPDHDETRGDDRDRHVDQECPAP